LEIESYFDFLQNACFRKTRFIGHADKDQPTLITPETRNACLNFYPLVLLIWHIFCLFRIMKLLLPILISVLCLPAMAQLNCLTKKADNKSVVTCKHLNGKPSTLESWDDDNHWGNVTGYDRNEKELFNYGLRKIGGHASVYLDYYTNGQVKKAEYRSAPDGGIQYYHIITEYDENGNQTRHMDFSQPDGIPRILTVPDPSSPKPIQKEIVKEGVLSITLFQVINETKFPATIFLKSTPGSQYTNKRNEIIDLKPKQKMVLDSITLTSLFLKPENVLSVEIAPKQKKKQKFKLIYASPIETVHKKVCTWHIIEE